MDSDRSKARGDVTGTRHSARSPIVFARHWPLSCEYPVGSAWRFAASHHCMRVMAKCLGALSQFPRNDIIAVAKITQNICQKLVCCNYLVHHYCTGLCYCNHKSVSRRTCFTLDPTSFPHRNHYTNLCFCQAECYCNRKLVSFQNEFDLNTVDPVSSYPRNHYTII